MNYLREISVLVADMAAVEEVPALDTLLDQAKTLYKQHFGKEVCCLDDPLLLARKSNIVNTIVFRQNVGERLQGG